MPETQEFFFDLYLGIYSRRLRRDYRQPRVLSGIQRQCNP